MTSGYSLSAPKRSFSDVEAEINSLSIKEREKLQRDLYGCYDSLLDNVVVEETDELIGRLLKEMENELQQIVKEYNNNTTSNETNLIQYYIRAIEIAPNFTMDPTILIQFIRCEEYNTRKAAERYILYWKERIGLWGETIAIRKITLNDFDNEDQVALELGGYQMCQKLDQFHRGIIFCNRNHCDTRTTHRKSQLRQLWYVHEAILENVEVQKNGIVSITGLGLRRSSLLDHDRKYDCMAVQLIKAFPIRINSIHHIVAYKLIQYVVPFVLYVLGSDFRSRYKCHLYSTSIYNELEQYGIASSIIPQAFGGTSVDPLDDYTTWLATRRQQCL